MGIVVFFASVFDGWIIGYLVFHLIKLILGENSLSRFLRVVMSVLTGGYYFYKVISYGAGYEGDFNSFMYLILLPIALFILMWLIAYTFKKR